jgi:hypothetical protein
VRLFFVAKSTFQQCVVAIEPVPVVRHFGKYLCSVMEER